MRRSLLVLLLGLLVAVVAGCGTGGSGSGSPGAPEPGDLAADAVAAAKSAGSAHYSVEATLERESGEPMRFRVEGDAGKGKGRADVTFEGEGQSLAGTLLYDGGAFFVRFLGKWYGDRSQVGRTDELERQFGTPDGVRKRFGDLFEGSVSEGPVADGVPTWAFNGRLNVDGILDLTAEEAPLEDDTRDQLEELAKNTRFTLLVGQADHLPRAFLLDVTGEGADLAGIAGPDAGKITFTLRGSFSRWGEPVSITPPSSYAPLQELFRQFFSF